MDFKIKRHGFCDYIMIKNGKRYRVSRNNSSGYDLFHYFGTTKEEFELLCNTRTLKDAKYLVMNFK